jgi:hypothetical protein
MVSATQEMQPKPWAENQCKDFIQTSYVCSSVLLDSITNPDGSIDYINTNMTKNGATYNYTYCATKGIGDGSFNTVCPDYNLSAPVSFQVTQNGEFAYGSWVVGILLALILVAGALFYISTFFSKEQMWIKSLFIIMGLIVLIVVAQVAETSAQGLAIANVIERVTITLIILLVFIIAYIFIIATKDVINKLKNAKKNKIENKYGPAFI